MTLYEFANKIPLGKTEETVKNRLKKWKKYLLASMMFAICLVFKGLTHAFFEDWLFAPGSYLCVFFWAMAYILQDFVPGRDAVSNKFPGMYSPFRPT